MVGIDIEWVRGSDHHVLSIHTEVTEPGILDDLWEDDRLEIIILKYDNVFSNNNCYDAIWTGRYVINVGLLMQDTSRLPKLSPLVIDNIVDGCYCNLDLIDWSRYEGEEMFVDIIGLIDQCGVDLLQFIIIIEF